jgi:hypothetical protein
MCISRFWLVNQMLSYLMETRRLRSCCVAETMASGWRPIKIQLAQQQTQQRCWRAGAKYACAERAESSSWMPMHKPSWPQPSPLNFFNQNRCICSMRFPHIWGIVKVRVVMNEPLDVIGNHRKFGQRVRYKCHYIAWFCHRRAHQDAQDASERACALY